VTDARFPSRWMGDRRFLKASPDALLLYQFAMWYAVANRTDGLIEDDDLPLLARGDARYAPELEKVGLWRREAGGWLIVDYADTQTPKAQLEALDVRRRSDRERSQRYRDNRKGSKESRDSSRDDKGQDRPGQARKGFDVGSDVNKPVADDDWPEPTPVGAGLPPAVAADRREPMSVCSICDYPIDPAVGRYHPSCYDPELEPAP
jgi:hypothetical protein